MQLVCFTVFDSAVGAHIMPFFMRSNGEAVRAFTAEVNNPQSNIFKSPKDFTLLRIGTFDDNTGVFEPEQKIALGNATEFLSSAQAT